jgi:hypothetical protein
VKTLALVEMAIIGILFLITMHQKGKNHGLEETNTHMKSVILHMETTLSKMSPNHCAVVLPGGMLCWEPAKHFYAGLKICDSCNERFAILAPSPPPLPIVA